MDIDALKNLLIEEHNRLESTLNIDFREVWKLTDAEGKPLIKIDNVLINARIELANAIIDDVEKQIQFLKAIKTNDNEL